MHTLSAALGRFALAASLLATLSSCMNKAGDAKGSPANENGGTMIESMPSDVVTLYPPAAMNSQDFVVINSIFDRLADIGDNLNTAGDSGFTKQLATGWKWAADSLSIAFFINPKARWHDGQPVQAKDVQFSFRAYADTTGASAQPALVGNIDSVSTPDSLTAVVWYKRRSLRQFMEATYNMYILPEHRLGAVAPRDRLASAFSKSPIGSGRFRFLNWDAGRQLQVVSDTSNYRGRAKLDRVIWSISGDFQASTLSTFAGESDFYEKMSPDNLPAALKSSTVRVVPYSQVGYSFLMFNLHARKSRAAPHPIFGDIRVRQALTMAVDRARVMRLALDTFATVSIGPAPRALIAYPDSVRQLPFDVAHAKALLDSAGWVTVPGKSTREKNGMPLAFEALVTSSSAPRVAYAQLLEQQWAAIGAKLTVRVLAASVIGQQMGSHDFDAWFGAYTVTPGLAAVPAAWGSRGFTNGRNYGGYSNAQFDATVDSALNAPSAARANVLWVRALNVSNADAPALWMYEEQSLGLLNRRIQPKTLRRDAWYAYLADWTIDPAQRIDRDRIGLGVGR